MKNRKVKNKNVHACLAIVFMLLMITALGNAKITTIPGPVFDLTVEQGDISTPDGGKYLMYGYTNTGTMQYPGPTLEVNQGDVVTVNLTNNIGEPVSILFPGQSGVTASGGTAGLLAQEAQPEGGSVSYSFTASEPGTYVYYSGSNCSLQIEMGLVGALIVRPTGYDPETQKWAYNHAGSAYDYEYLFLLSEMDPKIHNQIQFGQADQVDLTTYFPTIWFINGRCAPDTMLPANVPTLPCQPHNCMPRMHPGDKILLRFIGGGRDQHPFHTHGNNFLQIAQDGRLLTAAPAPGSDGGPDLAVSDFTLSVAPGQTYDAIFQWTGSGLGWDMYGHSPEDPMEPNEDPDDHGKPFPVQIPDQKDLTFGAQYSGSPFLGGMGSLPPGEGGFNLNGGFFYMWHSHNEKEMCNFDIFPGGLMTMLIVEPHGVVIQ